MPSAPRGADRGGVAVPRTADDRTAHHLITATENDIDLARDLIGRDYRDAAVELLAAALTSLQGLRRAVTVHRTQLPPSSSPHR